MFNNKIIIIATIILTILGLLMTGVLVAQAVIISLGAVIGFAIVLHKFPRILKWVNKLGRWFDLLVFVITFGIATSPFGFVVAVFISLYFSAYLSILNYFKNNNISTIEKEV